MAITTGDGFLGASKQYVIYNKTASRTTIAAAPFSLFDLAGNPGAGVLSVGNTANGIVPTDAISGYPAINSFGIGNTGYLYSLSFGNSVACRYSVVDTIFSCGAYAFNSNITLASQPSYASRIPSQSNFGRTMILFEAVTAFTGNPSVNVTYLNQSGVSKSTGVVAFGLAPTVGRHVFLPLAAGDIGVSQVNNVTATVATAGTFNIHVVRVLVTNLRVRSNNDGDTYDFFRTSTPEVYENSAIRVIEWADGTSSGIPDLTFVIANG